MKLHTCWLSVVVLFVFTSSATAQKKVGTYFNVKGYTEQSATSYLTAAQIDPIEGIWQSNDGFKYAIEKDVREGRRIADKYRIIVLSHNTSSPFWQTSYVKGFIDKTAVTGIYNIDYYTASRNYYNQVDIQVQTCIGMLESAVLLSFTRQDGAKIMLIRLFPRGGEMNRGGAANSSSMSTGSGFALHSGGYIVTNHHVIEDAKTIEVKGVQGNFNKKWPAELVVSDEKNDLAIIRIRDPRFPGFGNIPFSWRTGTAEVGENVFVLGYPMTSSMGEEVKLTNGIISSRTGFKGDISTYQVSAPVQPGNSGGPLFDKNGAVIGIVNARHNKAENASYAIKAGYLRSLMELLPQQVSLPVTNQLQGKTLTEQVRTASPFVYLIVVNDNEADGSGSWQSGQQGGGNGYGNGGSNGYGNGNRNGNGNGNGNGNAGESSTDRAARFYKEAEEKWKNGDARGAIESMNQSISASSEYAGSYFFRGYIYYYGIMNYEKAFEDFNRSVQMQPKMETAHLYRGLAQDKLGRKTEAIADFSKAIAINQDNTDAYFMRAFVKSAINDRWGSLADYDEIIKREKTAKPNIYKMGTVYNNKGYGLLQMGQLEESKKYLDRALVLEPKETYIWGSLGEWYYKKEDYKACIKHMEKSIVLAGGSIAASSDPGLPHYLMGLSKIKLGKVVDGCKDLSRAGELGKAEAYKEMEQYCNSR